MAPPDNRARIGEFLDSFLHRLNFTETNNTGDDFVPTEHHDTYDAIKPELVGKAHSGKTVFVVGAVSFETLSQKSSN